MGTTTPDSEISGPRISCHGRTLKGGLMRVGEKTVSSLFFWRRLNRCGYLHITSFTALLSGLHVGGGGIVLQRRGCGGKGAPAKSRQYFNPAPTKEKKSKNRKCKDFSPGNMRQGKKNLHLSCSLTIQESPGSSRGPGQEMHLLCKQRNCPACRCRFGVRDVCRLERDKPSRRVRGCIRIERGDIRHPAILEVRTDVCTHRASRKMAALRRGKAPSKD